MRGSMRRSKGRGALAVLLAALVVTFVLLASGTALGGPPWSDASNAWWVAGYGVTDTQAATVADGYPDGTFRPGLVVTRAQFAKMVVEGTGVPTAMPAVPSFSDVPKTNYFYPWIEGGAQAGIISGFGDGSFGPNNQIARQQADSILGSYLAQKELNTRGHIAGHLGNYPSLNTWYLAEGVSVLSTYADANRLATVHAPATAYLILKGVVQGTNSAGWMYLGPDQGLTRAQATALILRVRAVTFSTALPTVTSLNPSSGLSAGGNTVVITGTNFTDVTSVSFGSANVAFTVNSGTQITVTAPAGTVGTTVDITVTAAAGTSVTSAASKYTYGVPTITALNPASGPYSGGNSVVITGTNLTGATAVYFGAKAATFTVNSNTQITATAPSGTAGTTVDVTVTAPGGTTVTSAASKYGYGAPTVTLLSPTSGPAAGGTTVIIMGTGFTGVTSVYFGSKSAAYTVNSPTQITAVAPSGGAGSTVDVQVTTSAGTSATSSASKYSYGGPIVTLLTPNVGPAYGSNTVVISGTGFTGVTSVYFGNKPALTFTVNSVNQITAVAPSYPAGSVVDVTVTTASGTSGTSSATEYSYGTTIATIATIISVTPNHGPAGGGNTVVISGSGFGGATSVRFGAITIYPANFTVNPAGTTITLLAPAGTGTVDIRVNTATTQSANTSADNYTYAPVITLLTPSGGALAGGNTVTITGSGFTGATGVTFGGVLGTNLVVLNDSTITVRAPIHTPAETVQVRVVGKYDLSANNGVLDDYAYGAPVVSSLSPNHGPVAGGNTVVVNGLGFNGATNVAFGGVNIAPANFTVNASGTAITVTAPTAALASPTGAAVVDVIVTVAATPSANTANDNYTYAPTIASLSASTGSTAGGTHLTITGTGFITAATSVTFDGTSGTSVTVTNATTLTVDSPPHIAGQVEVRVVTTAGGTSLDAGTADNFTYVAGPAVTLVQPNVGPNAGGTVVTLTGDRFAGATGVTFGGVAGTVFAVHDDHWITVTSPPGDGTVDVIVQSLSGDSPVSSGAKFTYSPKVTGVLPINGPTYGGNQVVISGTGFTGATSVNFGGTLVAPGNLPANFVVNPAGTTITLTAPLGSAGLANVIVTTGAGAVTGTGVYTYVTPAATYVAQAAYKPTAGSWTSLTPNTLVNGTFVDLRVQVLDQWNHPMVGANVASGHPLYQYVGTLNGTKTPEDPGSPTVEPGNYFTTDINGYVYWFGEGGATGEAYDLIVGLDLGNNGTLVGDPSSTFHITWAAAI